MSIIRNKGNSMDIKGFFRILWRRRLTILLTLIATMTIVVIGTKRTIPVYQASTILRIAVSSGGSIEYSDYMYADRLMNTYVNIVTSRPMLEELMKRLALSQPPEIKAEIIPNTEFIKITVEYSNPSMAATVANTLADVLITQSNKLFIGGGKSLTEVLGEQMTLSRDDLEKARQEYGTLLLRTPPAPKNIEVANQLLQLKQRNYESVLQQYQQAVSREGIQASMITVFQTAIVPEGPSRPRVLLTITLGFITGLVGGLGLALILENLDTTLYEIEDIETATKLPALAKIPRANKAEITAFQEKFSPLVEAFRNLATNLLVTHHQSKKVLLLVSAEPNQGKSMIAFHLACSLAELGKNVVAVDCDTRIPRLQSLFHLPNQIGLKDVLEQEASLEDALQMSSFEGVQVLTSGSQLAHPSQMLGSIQMAKLLKSLKQQFDYVLLDSPAMLAVADVAALTPNADCLILVVRQAHAKKEAVQTVSSFPAVQNSKSTFLIVNEVEDITHYSYYKDRNKTGSLLDVVKGFLRRIRGTILKRSAVDVVR